MLSVENATRIDKGPNGFRYYHQCYSCEKEIGGSGRSKLSQRTGYCHSCVVKVKYPDGQELLTRIRKTAESRGHTVSLTVEQVSFLSQLRSCHYCGRDIHWIKSRINLDRKDSRRGYDWDNVVVCCPDCNKIKSSLLEHPEMKIAMMAVKAYRNSDSQDKKELEFVLSAWHDMEFQDGLDRCGMMFP